jgi:hypothetical protein
MRNTLTLALALLISSACLPAEPASPASEKDQKASSLITLQGCLHTDQSQFILTEPNGTSHALSGAAKQLGRLVRHEVEVAGKPGTRTVDTTSSGGASSVLEYPVFEVKTVTDLASTCHSPAH